MYCVRTRIEQRRSGLARGGGVSERLAVEAGRVESGHETRVRRGGLAVRDGRRPERGVRAGGADGAHAPPQAPRARAPARGVRQHTLRTHTRCAAMLLISSISTPLPSVHLLRIITSTLLVQVHYCKRKRSSTTNSTCDLITNFDEMFVYGALSCRRKCRPR